MSVRADLVERLLEALSPTLSAELERVVAETRESIEQEFQIRIDAAVREAEAASERAAESRLQQAVDDVRENTRKQVTEELQALSQSHEKATEETLSQMRKAQEDTIHQLQSEWNTERARLQEERDQWRIFAEAQQQLSAAGSQAEMLVRFLKLAEPFAGGIGVYVAKSDGLALWKTRGKGAFPPIVSQETIDPELFFKQVSVRGAAVAAVCAAQPLKIDALNFLVGSLERAIELFGLKLKAPIARPRNIETSPAGNAGAPAVHVQQTPSHTQTQTHTQGHPVAVANGSAPLGAPANEEKAHSDARRTARLLVSEIKLYHEQELKEGRERADIYHRLQKEIDRSREIYRQQTSAFSLGNRDYFHEELVRILTENDPSRLGEGYPGPL